MGFGHFFQGLLRRIVPIALNVGKTAISAMRDAQEQVPSVKDTIKSAVRPATNAGIHRALSQIDPEQQMSDGKRGRKQKCKYKGHNAKRTKPNINNSERGSGASWNSSNSTSHREAVPSELNLFQALPNHRTVIAEMVQDFAPIDTII